MKQIIASVFLTYYLILRNIFFCIFSLIIITASVYKLRLAEANILSCLTYNASVFFNITYIFGVFSHIIPTLVNNIF